MKICRRKWPAVAGVVVWIGTASLSCSGALMDQGAPLALSGETGEAASMKEISPGAGEVVRLAESGMEKEVILAYVDNAQTFFNLAADDIIYLNDLGISSDLITAMVRRDAVLREQGLGTTVALTDEKASVPGADTPAPVPQPVYVTNAPPEVVYFYDALTPYGTWIELEGSGWCWQPRIVVIDHSWRPYWQGGRWIYTDFGWYWHSDYSWGWAPFHYGRWRHHHRHGWVWSPDLMWAPAWVSWRFSDEYCGWAPVPPGARFVMGQGWRFNNVSVGINFDFHLGLDLFTFVELRYFHESRPHLHALSAARVKEIQQRTKVINDYGFGRDNRIVNRGVAVEKVVAASHREIRRVTIADVPAAQAGVIRRDQLARVGSRTVLYRPELKAPVRRGPVLAQRIDERRSIVRPPPRRPALAAPHRSPAPGAKVVPPGSVPPRTRGLPQRGESRSVRPAPAPSASRDRGVGPSPLQPGRSVQPPPRAVAPTQTGIVRRPVTPPSRVESPKGRRQRLSNEPRMRQPSSPAANPSPGRPPTQRGAERRSPSSQGGKRN